MNRQFKGINALVHVCLVLLVATWYGLTQAQVPDKLNYQGYLTDNVGAPITGARSMIFTLYDAGGAVKYAETQTVNVASGAFNVAIGSVTAMNLPFDIPYFLGVKVGADPEMTPRQAVLSSPYAQRADTANLLAATATVSGSQITGSISVATLPAVQLSGTIGTAQIANNAVTQAKLSPVVGGTSGKVLGTDGTNLVWQTAGGGGTVTGVSASAPLASSGGIAPNISLTGSVPVANGGTGQTTLATNGVLIGQGTGAVSVTVGAVGQVLTGTAGAPAWSGSPALSGNLTLVNPSTATTGNIMKGASAFIHNFGVLNTFIGEAAGNFTMTGSSNTAVGSLALVANTTGVFNTANGSGALQDNTIGTNNTATGYFAMQGNSTGNGNTAYGNLALQSNSTGSDNIAVGSHAGARLTTGSDNIDIGHRGVAGESGVIRIGTLGSQFLTYIIGIYNAPALVNGAAVFVEPDGQLGTNPSSRRYKDDIADMDAASRAMMQLRPVTFHYKNDRNPAGRTLQYGLVAEEVAEVYPGLVAHSADGQIEAVMYQFLAPMLLNEYQNQQRTIDAQAWAIRSQTTRIAELERDRQVQLARIEALETRESELALLKQQAAQLALLQRQVAQLAADRAQLAAK